MKTAQTMRGAATVLMGLGAAVVMRASCSSKEGGGVGTEDEGRGDGGGSEGEGGRAVVDAGTDGVERGKDVSVERGDDVSVERVKGVSVERGQGVICDEKREGVVGEGEDWVCM